MDKADQFHQAILRAVKTETDRIVDEEAKAAATRVEERVRAAVGGIATRVATNVNFERFGPDIRITVRLPDRD
jgi:hypothetical protein